MPPTGPPRAVKSTPARPDASGISAPRKPVRVWLLQAICLLQLAHTAVQIVSDLRTGGRLRDIIDAIWLGQAVFWSLLLVALGLALQRVLPRPGIVAPVLATVWWAHGLVLHLQDWAALPAPRTVDAVEFGAILAETAMLWLAASLIYHRKTRAYLTHARVGKRQMAIARPSGRAIE